MALFFMDTQKFPFILTYFCLLIELLFWDSRHEIFIFLTMYDYCTHGAPQMTLHIIFIICFNKKTVTVFFVITK